jgi:pantoate--beta-alanine ligase
MTLEVCQTIAGLQSFLGDSRANPRLVGLVPTMGALHPGHASLISNARQECDLVVVSIFVNALQFGPAEDLTNYPRRLDSDLTFCRNLNVDAVFAPSDEEMYPEDPHTFVEVGPEAKFLCGTSRPGHFRGVATVVLKLLHVVDPDRAYFGEKDIQQLAVISRMAVDLNLRAKIVGLPTVREPDGLAISSRNEYLSAAERSVASVLHRALRIARQRIADGDRDPSVAKDAARMVLDLEPMVRTEYLEVVDSVGMQPVDEISGPVRVVGAIWIGGTRLIDNLLCELPAKRRRSRKSRPARARDV